MEAYFTKLDMAEWMIGHPVAFLPFVLIALFVIGAKLIDR